MRQVLVDEARRRTRVKRGGGAQQETLNPEELKIDQQAEFVLALDRGLEKLGRLDERARAVVEYRFFGGLTERETAEVLGIGDRTVRRAWAQARTWLALELGLGI